MFSLGICTSSLSLVCPSAEHYLSSSNYMDCISSLTGSNGCNLNSSFKGSDLPELFSKLGLGKYTDVFQQQEVSHYLLIFPSPRIFVWVLCMTTSRMKKTHWLVTAFTEHWFKSHSLFLLLRKMWPHFLFMQLVNTGCVFTKTHLQQFWLNSVLIHWNFWCIALKGNNKSVFNMISHFKLLSLWHLKNSTWNKCVVVSVPTYSCYWSLFSQSIIYSLIYW